MSKKVTIGGDRLGSGKKMETALHNYARSTHNLSEKFASSMAPGVLIPFYSTPALNGDTFEFDLDAMARTIPTQGPLMGTFKLQMDLFICPIRLYQGILHNNALNLGLNMKNVMLPKITISTTTALKEKEDLRTSQISTNCLMKYLGVSGLGRPATRVGVSEMTRSFNALPVLAYYDIFKSYYANKMEEKAYVITGMTTDTEHIAVGNRITATLSLARQFPDEGDIYVVDKNSEEEAQDLLDNYSMGLPNDKIGELQMVRSMVIEGEELDPKYIYLTAYDVCEGLLSDLEGAYVFNINVSEDKKKLSFTMGFANYTAFNFDKRDHVIVNDEIKLQPFDLDNIDKMRRDILKLNDLDEQLEIEPQTAYYPYLANVQQNQTTLETYNKYSMNGLCVKTYQSDLFNNWVNTGWIDGEDGINQISAVDVSNGVLTMDALNLAQKVYNMLNRVAVAGGTYQDWQQAVYTQNVAPIVESPIYIGGMSSEICFEEVVSHAAVDDAALGSLAGKGRLVGKKGGKIIAKISEPCYIMGIVSITPRIQYCQGNKWDMTELQTMDDFHKPALDGIGFQNLMVEQMAFWDVIINGSTIIHRGSAGKVPAWINYMTAYDKVFGDFAQPDGKAFMVLSRNYGVREDTEAPDDITTYIDPTKFNYAFAHQELSAQNFWVQIMSNVKARRLMSAKIIPNL